jgi:hypothetical protein
VTADADALAFFNDLSGRLKITLTEPAKPASERVMNLVAAPTSRIADVAMVMEVRRPEYRDPTDDEWARVVVRAKTIRMRSDTAEHVVVDHAAPNGEHFTVRDLRSAIAETEQRGRGDSKWIGGVDVHHVYFEGIVLGADGVWTIRWGS